MGRSFLTIFYTYRSTCQLGCACSQQGQLEQSSSSTDARAITATTCQHL